MTYKSLFLWAIFLMMGGPGLFGDIIGSEPEEDQAYEWGGRTRSPKLELGIGMFTYNYNDYRGAAHRSTVIWPLPYFAYRGKYIDAENSMVKGYLYDKGRFRLGMSLMGSLRVESGENITRQGMPSLDPLFEVGPMAMYDLWVDKNKRNFLTVGVPIRLATSVDFFHAKNEGYFISPYIAYTATEQPLTMNTFIQASMGVMFATHKYHNYYYSVDPKYENSFRPAYRAEGGYSGAQFMVFMSHKFKDVYAFAFTRYDYLDGASFIKSPMVQRNDFLSIGGGLVWYFYQSKELQDRNRIDK